MAAEPSPEVKALIKEFCRVEREKHGPEWKKILAKQMAKASEPYVKAILNMGKKNAAP